ncbi:MULTISPECIES: hypothetical protein [unclassified Nocardioides]|uniref:hypothetical protein n=1 Tax=unclassified Nocardioides TaxID=2615069 RepID=UPI0006FF11A2|nr:MULTISPECIES: hypothetical protein [unclassified Nocardioides]KRA38526.1 hypothetical protein ASD81_07870 [Nocardioides sp. Root614]KRA92486.1 hypothetical protein ASD84_08135 [Nocardioides sp. Root682]
MPSASRSSRAHPRPLRRRGLRRSGTFLACLAVVAATLVSSGAEAVAFGPYNIDGTVPGGDGAQHLDDPSGSAKEIGPKNGSPTKISVIHTATPPMLELTNPNGQVDLKQAWLNLKRQGGADFLYFAWERDSNTGSGFISFEFMKNGLPSGCATSYAVATCNPWRTATEAGNVKVGRSAGDFLILWDQSGSSAVLSKRVWTQASPNAPLVLGAPVLLSADPTKAAGLYSPDKTRGEAAINLTLSGLTDGQSCTTFANVIPSTVTGNSDTADYKDTILQKIDPLSSCAPTISTTPADGDVSIGSGVVEVADVATVGLTGGNGTPSGSVSYWLCDTDTDGPTCGAGEGELIGSTNLTGNTFPVEVTSPTAFITAAGSYCWRATWSGDAANGIPAASENDKAGECFEVSAATPTLSTEAGDDTTAGGTVSDTATLSGTATQPVGDGISTTAPVGAADAGGTITFDLYGPSDTGCGQGEPVYTVSVDVEGDGEYSTPDPQFEPDSVGVYHWVATYSGDDPNTNGVSHNTDCDEDSEEVEVTDVPSTIETAQSWVPNDSATLSAAAGGDMKGTVTFDLYATGDCTGAVVFTEDVAIDDPSGVIVGTSNEDAFGAGDYSWQVTYDSTNPAQRDIDGGCEETSSLAVDDGDPVSSD